MTFLTIIAIALSAGYGVLMLAYRIGWHKQRRMQPPARHFQSDAHFSIIVPARNEAQNIRPLLNSLFSQRFPPDTFEVLLVDDHSTDDTARIAEDFGHPNLTVVRLAEHFQSEALNSAKKMALSTGISYAQHHIIVTTDADCTTSSDSWLIHYAFAFADDQCILAAGPVNYTKERGVLYLFQSLDFMAMQGITAAAHALRLGTMSNGANLAFSRDAYDAVDGYNGIDHLASGDDYLLTRKLSARFGHERMRYILDTGAVVQTAAQPTWNAFLQQRIRWASKSGKYNDPRLTAILMLVYIVNVWLVVLAITALFVEAAGTLFLLSLLLKVLLELFFLWPVAAFFGKRRELLFFPLLQPLHIIYIVLAGFLGMRGGYRWKGRNVR